MNGFLCELKNADDLAGKMETMAGLDEATLKTFGSNGRQKMMAYYDEKFVINKYVDALRAFQQAS